MSDVAGKDAASITMSDFSGYIEKYGKSIAKFQRNHSEERTLAEKHATEEDVQAQIAACYTAVPRIFFASNFDLKDPTIFAAALNAVGNGGNSKDEPHRATSTSTLQPHAHPEEDGGEAAISTLSTHLETTELALLSLISSRSDSFFSQLHNLQLFREQITSTCHAIVDTRQSLDNIHQRFVAGNIRVPRLKRRKANAESLQRIVHMILKVQKTQQVVQSNLEHGHFGEALDAIHQAQVALQGPLAAISSLKPLRVQLDSFVKLIANTMASRFLDLAASMNVLFLDETESEQLSRRVSFKEKLLPLVKGLVRVGQLRQVMSKYRGRLTEVVTLVVRTAVSASLETSGAEDGTSTSRDGDSDGDTSRGARGGQGGKSTSVVKKLRSLNDKEFQSMLKDVLEHLMSVVTQASSVHSMLLVALEDTRDDVSENTEASNSGSPMSRRSASIGASSARQKKLQREGCERDSREALEHMWRVAQRHIGKMFEVREHELSVQPLEKQKALWDMVSEFVTQAQKKCGRRGDTLLNTLMSQVKKYLEQAQLRLKARVEHALTRDGWGEAQILPAHTKSLRAISNFAEGKPRDDAPTNSGVDVADPSAATVPEKSLRFGDETFHVPTCVLELLSVFDIHLQCVQDFPAHVITIMHQILDLVGMFNQRTTELILGTGALALETSSLKRITDKHLALVSQSLLLLQKVLPLVKDALGRHMSTRQHLLLQEFDKKATDLQLHNNQIYDKFVSITAGLVQDKCGKIEAQKLTWGTPGAASPTPFMAEMVKSISTLRKHMVNLMSPAQVTEVFTRIVKEVLNQKVPQAYRSIDRAALSDEAVKHVLADIAHLVDSLRNVRGLRDRGRTLDRFFRDKFVLGLA